MSLITPVRFLPTAFFLTFFTSIDYCMIEIVSPQHVLSYLLFTNSAFHPLVVGIWVVIAWLTGWRPLNGRPELRIAVRRKSKSRGRWLSLRPTGCTPGLSVTQQRRCICSCRLWRYITVMPLPLLRMRWFRKRKKDSTVLESEQEAASDAASDLQTEEDVQLKRRCALFFGCHSFPVMCRSIIIWILWH